MRVPHGITQTPFAKYDVSLRQEAGGLLLIDYLVGGMFFNQDLVFRTGLTMLDKGSQEPEVVAREQNFSLARARCVCHSV